MRTEPKAAGIVPLRRFPETSNHDKARTVPIEGSSIPSSKLLARMTVLISGFYNNQLITQLISKRIQSYEKIKKEEEEEEETHRSGRFAGVELCATWLPNTGSGPVKELLLTSM